MYHLLVSGRADTWNGEPFVNELSRSIREYTAEPITKKFGDLNDAAIAQLLTMPALFAYEFGLQLPARLGRITRIRTRLREVRIEYTLDVPVVELPVDALIQHQW